MNMPRERTKREEEVTEELKRFMMQEIARGFSLFEGVLLVVMAQDWNECYTQYDVLVSCHL